MTKSDFIFMLLRSALWQKKLEYFKMTPWEYKEVMKEGDKQCVTGLITDCLESNNMGLKKPCVIHMLKYKKSVIAENSRINENLHSLCQLLEDNNISYVVVKGQTLGAYYPHPELRTPGDVDFYVPSSDYSKALSVIRQSWNVPLAKGESNMHRAFKHNNTEFEMHNMLCEFPSKKMQNEFNQIIDTNQVDFVIVADREVPTLSPTLNVFYTFLHLYHHLIKLGVALRQLCDLTVLIHNQCDRIDRSILLQQLKKLGFLKAFLAIGSILVNKLGLPEAEFPFQLSAKDTKYGSKLLRIILKHGNWGQYERCSHERKSTSYLWERATFRITNQMLLFRLSPRYNRALLSTELPQKTWERIRGAKK